MGGDAQLGVTFKGRSTRIPTFQHDKVLCSARMAAMTSCGAPADPVMLSNEKPSFPTEWALSGPSLHNGSYKIAVSAMSASPPISCQLREPLNQPILETVFVF